MPTDRPPDYVPPERLDVEQIIEVLNRHNVDYVLVGGMAAVLHGSSVHTADVDALIREEYENLKHLGGALRELGAQRSTDPDAFISRIEEFETDAPRPTPGEWRRVRSRKVRLAPADLRQATPTSRPGLYLSG